MFGLPSIPSILYPVSWVALTDTDNDPCGEPRGSSTEIEVSPYPTSQTQPRVCRQPIMAAPPDESSKKPLPVLYIRPSFWQYFPSFSEWVVKPFMQVQWVNGKPHNGLTGHHPSFVQGLMFGVAQHAGLFLCTLDSH